MSAVFPLVYLARHGETAWSLSGQHTGLTDLPLTPRGERNAGELGARLQQQQFAAVFTSPLQRAFQTCRIAGYADQAKVDHDLVEWHYGDYEGLKSAEIRSNRPDWLVFRDGCPGGESVADVGARVDRFLAKVRQIDGDVLVFSSGHLLRVLAARWLGLTPSEGRLLMLSTASLSILGYEHNRDEPVLKLWNDTTHVGP